jgi:hypothetical protein
MTESRLEKLSWSHWLYWHSDGREWFIPKECYRNEWRATVQSVNEKGRTIISDYGCPGTPEGKAELTEKLEMQRAGASSSIWFFDEEKHLKSLGGDRLKKHVAKWEWNQQAWIKRELKGGASE